MHAHDIEFNRGIHRRYLYTQQLYIVAARRLQAGSLIAACRQAGAGLPMMSDNTI